jgi:hypothetical protein
MRCTQIWCAQNRLELSFAKSKVMVFFEPSARRRQRAHIPVRILGSFPHPHFHDIAEVPSFHYLGNILDSRLTFHPHCKRVLKRIWHNHHKLVVRRS